MKHSFQKNLMLSSKSWISVLIDALVSGKRRYTLVKDVDDMETGVYDKPLPCFGCGIGWFLWVLFSYSTPCFRNYQYRVNLIFTPFDYISVYNKQLSPRICVPAFVVLCYISLFRELLPQRSSRKSWTCCFRNHCEYLNMLLCVRISWLER